MFYAGFYSIKVVSGSSIGVHISVLPPVNGAQITPRTLSFVKKLVSTFGIGFESGSNVYSSYSSSASESLARRAQATAQDPVFHKLKEQFVEDFDFRLVLLVELQENLMPLYRYGLNCFPSQTLFPKTVSFLHWEFFLRYYCPLSRIL